MYTDIHTHILYDTDDGPSSRDEMFGMLERAYEDGVRTICATPHFNFTFYGDNTLKSAKAFNELVHFAKSKYPDMSFYLGNEVFYHNACTAFLKDKVCNSLNGSKYVLVDFSSSESKFTIISAMKNMIGHGYIPILAHAERYISFGFSIAFIRKLKEMGVIIQINAASLIGSNGFREKIVSRKTIHKNLCDIVASDSHNITTRPTCMKQAAEYLTKKYGKHAAHILMHTNPNSVLNNQRI